LVYHFGKFTDVASSAVGLRNRTVLGESLWTYEDFTMEKINGATGSGPGTTPEEQLKERQDVLRQTQSEIDQKNKSVVSIQNQIKVLEAGITEIKQTLSGYDEARLKQQLAESGKELGLKTDAAKCAVKKEDQEKINATVVAFDKALDKQGEDVKTAFTATQTAKEASSNADASVGLKQAAYDNKRKGPDPALKELKTLLDSAGQAQIKSDYISLYFYVVETQKVFDPIKIPSKAEYTASLEGALNELDDAKQDALDKKAKADQLWKEYTEAKQKYDAAIASRRTDLLKKLKEEQKPVA
jgi:hypothetical protein